MKHGTDSRHMWLLVAAVAVALLFGWSLGWALALAVIACGVMLAAVFWIGRSSAQEISARSVDADEAVEGR